MRDLLSTFYKETGVLINLFDEYGRMHASFFTDPRPFCELVQKSRFHEYCKDTAFNKCKEATSQKKIYR